MSFVAAAGKVDLGARPGLWLTGFGDRERPSDALLDPIEARAVALSDGQRAVVLVSLDVVGLDTESVAVIRSFAPTALVLVSCTHTHAGPAAMRLRGVMGFVDRAWLAEALSGVGTLVADLLERMEPAEIASATSQAPGIAFNRQPGGGPVDENVTALGIRAASGAPIATIGSYACHPVVLGNRNFALSADFPGAFARAVDREGGVGLFLQGCAGDIDPALNRERGWSMGTHADAQQIGATLADAALRALDGADYRAEGALWARAQSVRVPLAASPAVEDRAAFEAEHRAAFEAAMRLPDPLAEALGERSVAPSSSLRREACVPLAMLEWLQDYRALEREGQVPGSVRAEVFVASIGTLRIAAVPFEAYTGAGAALRDALGGGLALGYANGLLGYLASDEAIDAGGYGPGGSHLWFPRLPKPLARGATGVLADAVRALAG